MKSIINYPNKQINEDDSTIQLEFTESVAQMLATRHDMNSNSYSSFQQYYSRKRCASRESEKTINEEEENSNKKQRNDNDHLAFFQNTRNQQIVSLSESDESQCIQTNGKIVFQLRTKEFIFF